MKKINEIEDFSDLEHFNEIHIDTVIETVLIAFIFASLIVISVIILSII